jgi:hypothetical protein
MEYNEALEKLSQAYNDRYSVEFPFIFSMTIFEGKSLLEVGPAEGYFQKDAAIMAGSVESTNSLDKLPYEDKSFDIVLSRWVIQNVDDYENFTKEMCRVAKDNVIIVLPSEDGDETRLLSIRTPDKFNTRKERIERIKKCIIDSGFKVREERKLLNFVYSGVIEAAEVYYTLGFGDDATDEEVVRLKKFINERKFDGGVRITQGASFICGYK